MKTIGDSNAGERAVGAEGDPGGHEGVVDFMVPSTSPPPPPQSLPLRRMLCSPRIEHSRRSQLSREGSACGGACRREALGWGGGRAAVPLPQSRAVNGGLPAPGVGDRRRANGAERGVGEEGVGEDCPVIC